MHSSSLGNLDELHPWEGGPLVHPWVLSALWVFLFCGRFYFVGKESSHQIFPGESEDVPDGPPNTCSLQPGPLTVRGRHRGGGPGSAACPEADGDGFFQAESQQFVIHMT